MAILRFFQRAQTAISPHANNRRILIPPHPIGGGAPGPGTTPGVFTFTAGDNTAIANGYRRNSALAPPNDAYGVIDSGDINFNGNDMAELWTEGPTGLERWQIGFNGTGLPNTDATWISVSITGIFTGGQATQVQNRAAMTFGGNSGANTVWRGGASSISSFVISGNVYEVVFS